MHNLLAVIVYVIFASFAPSSSATIMIFHADLFGSAEVPPTGSPATGDADITVDTIANTLFIDVVFSGLVGGPAAAAHIHCCVSPGNNVAVAVGFPGFPAATSGTYSHTFNLLDVGVYTAGFVTVFGGGTVAGAEAALIAGLNTRQAYVNIHNAQFPGGEIRGIVERVPEPASLALLGIGLAGLAASRRRKLN